MAIGVDGMPARCQLRDQIDLAGIRDDQVGPQPQNAFDVGIDKRADAREALDLGGNLS